MRRALLACLTLGLWAATPVGLAQDRRNVIETLQAAIESDPGLTAVQRQELSEALRERFADYGLQTVSGARRQAVQVALRMIVEGSFDEAASDRTAAVAFASYQAAARGAPAEVVEGIGLYGFRKQLSAERIAAWANGYHQMTQNGVPPEVAADLVRAAMENDWQDSVFDVLKWSLVQAARQKFDVRAYAIYLLGHMQTAGQRPGALTAKAQAYFRQLAKSGAKPQLPDYEGVFNATPLTPAPPRAQAKKTVAQVQKTAAPAAVRPIDADRPQRQKPTGATRFQEIWPGLERASMRYLGTPYVWGGVTRRGIDCSALTQNSYGENDIAIPRVSKQQWKSGQPIDEGRWRQGDLVFFNTMGVGVSHVGMITDVKGPRFIHASSSKGVVIADLSKNYYRTRYLGARRIVP